MGVIMGICKSSKFAECYNELRSNKKLRDELSELSGHKLKSKLAEAFPNTKISEHFIRTAKEIIKKILELIQVHLLVSKISLHFTKIILKKLINLKR